MHAYPHTLTSAQAIRKTFALISRAALVIRTTCVLFARAALAIVRSFCRNIPHVLITNYMRLTGWLNISQINLDSV